MLDEHRTPDGDGQAGAGGEEDRVLSPTTNQRAAPRGDLTGSESRRRAPTGERARHGDHVRCPQTGNSGAGDERNPRPQEKTLSGMQDLQNNVSKMDLEEQFSSDDEVIIDKMQTGSSSRSSRDRSPTTERLLSQKLSKNFTRFPESDFLPKGVQGTSSTSTTGGPDSFEVQEASLLALSTTDRAPNDGTGSRRPGAAATDGSGAASSLGEQRYAPPGQGQSVAEIAMRELSEYYPQIQP